MSVTKTDSKVKAPAAAEQQSDNPRADKRYAFAMETHKGRRKARYIESNIQGKSCRFL